MGKTEKGFLGSGREIAHTFSALQPICIKDGSPPFSPSTQTPGNAFMGTPGIAQYPNQNENHKGFSISMRRSDSGPIEQLRINNALPVI